MGSMETEISERQSSRSHSQIMMRVLIYGAFVNSRSERSEHYKTAGIYKRTIWQYSAFTNDPERNLTPCTTNPKSASLLATSRHKWENTSLGPFDLPEQSWLSCFHVMQSVGDCNCAVVNNWITLFCRPFTDTGHIQPMLSVNSKFISHSALWHTLTLE
jgi:hypothetical protein